MKAMVQYLFMVAIVTFSSLMLASGEHFCACRARKKSSLCQVQLLGNAQKQVLSAYQQAKKSGSNKSTLRAITPACTHLCAAVDECYDKITKSLCADRGDVETEALILDLLLHGDILQKKVIEDGNLPKGQFLLGPTVLYNSPLTIMILKSFSDIDRRQHLAPLVSVLLAAGACDTYHVHTARKKSTFGIVSAKHVQHVQRSITVDAFEKDFEKYVSRCIGHMAPEKARDFLKEHTFMARAVQDKLHTMVTALVKSNLVDESVDEWDNHALRHYRRVVCELGNFYSSTNNDAMDALDAIFTHGTFSKSTIHYLYNDTEPHPFSGKWNEFNTAVRTMLPKAHTEKKSCCSKRCVVL